MKKNMIWFFALLIVVAFIPISLILSFHYINVWKFSANYEEYANDFNTVKNHLLTQYPDVYEKCLTVSHMSRDGSYQIQLYDRQEKYYLKLPDDVQMSLETICYHAFPDKDADLGTIWIQGDRISFCTDKGRYALVFSPNQKPTWLNSPNRPSSVRVKTIEDGWYHVREK